MTSEVVVINRHAVALAADSAMTLQGGKVLNSANKLFMLAPGYPIGVLIYNNASLMGVSWELIIKLYRDRLLSRGIRFPHLSGYTDDFMDFIKQQSEILFPQVEQDEFISYMIEHLMYFQIVSYVGERTKELIIEQGRKILGQEGVDIATRRIHDLCMEWESTDNLFDEEEVKQVANRLEENYLSEFNEMYDLYLGALNLKEETRERLWLLFTHWFTKSRWFNGAYSGVVFAGYGDLDLYPSAIEYRCESYVCGSLKHSKTMVTSAKEQVGVYSFAQDDIIKTLMNGVHPQVWESLYGIMVDQEETEQSKKQFGALKKELENAMLARYTMSTISMVAALPKDDLALMAETLVNITSFMRRVSTDVETVGGPTDVAVISKKDGFIWIKRKHYFDAQHNYHFFAGESGQYARRGQDEHPGR